MVRGAGSNLGQERQHLEKGQFTFTNFIFKYSFDDENKIDALKYLII